MRDKGFLIAIIGGCVICFTFMLMWRSDIKAPKMVPLPALPAGEAEATEAETMLPTEMSTASEVMTEMSLPTEALTECPVTHENGAETAEPTVAEEIPAEPSVEPLRPLYAFTVEDEDLLLRVASCEAGNQGVLGIALVMRVVLNRAEVYNMSIKDVILAPRQFSVVGCDKWNNGYIAPDAYEALDCIKNGWDGSQGALFFCAPWANAWHRSAKQYLFTAGGHEFYK